MMRTRVAMISAGLLAAQIATASDFSVASPDLAPGGFTEPHVFSGFGCTGSNISPELHWRNPPPGTKSFAVTLYDPDVATGSGWWHWVIFNIPSDVSGLARNAGSPEAGFAPAGSIQSRTDFGTPGYGGPCPPIGDKPHRYRLTVYALKAERIPLDAEASGALVGYYLHQNLIASAVFEAAYGRRPNRPDPADEGARDVISDFGGCREGEC